MCVCVCECICASECVCAFVCLFVRNGRDVPSFWAGFVVVVVAVPTRLLSVYSADATLLPRGADFVGLL